MLYLSILFLLTIFYSISKNNRDTRIFFKFCLILFILLAGLRFHVGGDSLAYEKYFKPLPNLSELRYFNFSVAEYKFSWYLLNAVSKSLNENFYVFQIIHAIIINVIVFWYIKKYSENKWLSLIFYFIFIYFYFNMEIMRESLAISVFLLGVPALLNKKWLSYYILCLISTTFHSSAYITLFFPFLMRNWKNWETLLIYLTIIVVFLLFTPKDLISHLNLPQSIVKKSGSYSKISITIYGYLFSILKLLPFVIIYFIRKQNNLKNNLDKLMYIFLLLGLISCFVPGFYRFQNYLILIALIYVADSIVLFKSFNSNTTKNTMIFWCMVGLIFFNQALYLSKSTEQFEKGTRIYHKYYPYHSIFNPEIIEKRERAFFNQWENSNE